MIVRGLLFSAGIASCQPLSAIRCNYSGRRLVSRIPLGTLAISGFECLLVLIIRTGLASALLCCLRPKSILFV